jgi:lysophospholipase L1-like esterase
MNDGISGNAGLFTCAEDLGIYIAMLLNGGEWNGVRILSPQTVKAMTTIPYGYERFGRSLGWDLHSAYSSCNGDLFSDKTFGHTGYTGTTVVVDPEADLGLILLINSVHPEDGHGVVRLRSVIANIVASSIKDNPRIYHDYYYKRIKAFYNEPEITDEDIVMLGNSLTEGGGDWSKRLKTKNVVNRGIIGDEALGIYDRLDDIVTGHPKRIYLMIGVNDVSHNATKDSIIGNIEKVVAKIRRQSPQTEVYLQSMLPINESTGVYGRLKGKTDLIPKLNADLQRLAKTYAVKYIDLFPLFKEDGSNALRMELTSDGLHLKEKGYKIWSDALRKTL